MTEKAKDENCQQHVNNMWKNLEERYGTIGGNPLENPSHAKDCPCFDPKGEPVGDPGDGQVQMYLPVSGYIKVGLPCRGRARD